MKTPISYYGGKQAIIGHLLELRPNDVDVYTETFFGGGSLYWAMDPIFNETINDKLDIVVNFYRVLKTQFRQLNELVDQSLISRTMHQQALMIVQKKVPADCVTLAWAFWYCANFSFSCKIGGGIKFSNFQDCTVPQNLRNKKKNFTDQLVSRIEKTHIENTDALTILKSRNVPGAFHYQDPPYIGSDQGHYKGYTLDDFQALLNFNAKECKGKFLLSHYNHPLLDEYIQLHGWHKKEITHRLKAPRKTGPEKVEVLVSNYQVKKDPDLFTNHH